MMTPVQDHLDRLTSAHPGDAESEGGLGVALVMVDGHRYVSGSRATVPLAALASPLVHALALEDLGVARVGERVGAIPDVESEYRVDLEPGTGRALNPLQNAGVVATAALVKGRGGRDRAARLLQLVSSLLGREVSVTDSAVKAENRAQQHTRAAAWLLKSAEVLDMDAEALLEDIATVRAVPVTVEDLALLAGTLAHGGVHPVSGERLLDVADGHLTEVEDAGRQHCIGPGVDRRGEMLDGTCTARSNHRDMHGFTDRTEHGQVEPGLCAVGVHRVEQDLSHSEVLAAARPFDGVDPCPATTTVCGDLPTGRSGIGPRRNGASIHRQHDALGSEATTELTQ